MADYAVMPLADYQDACEAVREKTGSTAAITSGELAGQIRGIESGGVELAPLTTPASEAEIFEGYEVYGDDGVKKTGSFTLSEPLTEQDALIAQILTALEGKAAGGGSTEPDPSELYQRVEYITSDGTAYILTDFIADNTCGAEMVLSFPNYADHTWMGSRNDSGSTRFFAPYAYSASIWYAGFNGNVKISASTQVETIYRCQVNFLNSRLTTVHDEAGTLKGSTSISGTLTAQTYPICLFTQNYEGVPRAPRIFDFYSARCSKGYDVVREYVPCYRKSDGVAGVYEKFTGEFLTTPVGAFTCGPEIDW